MRFGLGDFGHFLQVHAAVGLVVVDAQQARAVGKLADPPFGGGFQNFCCHLDTFHGRRDRVRS